MRIFSQQPELSRAGVRLPTSTNTSNPALSATLREHAIHADTWLQNSYVRHRQRRFTHCQRSQRRVAKLPVLCSAWYTQRLCNSVRPRNGRILASFSHAPVQFLPASSSSSAARPPPPAAILTSPLTLLFSDTQLTQLLLIPTVLRMEDERSG